MSKYRELQEQISKLQNEAATILKAERDQAISGIIEQMTLFGISVDDLKIKGTKNKKSKSPVDAKFKDPATGKTWSGRGRQPTWIKGSRDSYLIK